MNEFVNLHRILSWRQWRELIRLNREDIRRTNMYLVFLISIVFMTVGAVLTLTAFLIRDTHLVPLWIAFICVSALFLLLSFKGRENELLATHLIWLFQVVLLCGSLYAAYFASPRANFISVIVFLIIIPLMFIERPEWILLISGAATAACVIANTINPSPLLPPAELTSNCLFCGLGGMLFGIYTGYIKLMAVENSRLLKLMARTDESPHLLNRNSFFEDYAFSAQQEDLSGLFMIDVNGFKSINDTYGHQFGDTCLMELSALLNRIGEENHIIFYRYGGDEFVGAVKISEDGMAADPKTVMTEIEERLAANPLKAPGGKNVTLSISIGYSSLRHAVSNPLKDCIHKADEEMYREKKEFHQKESQGKL